MWQPWQTLAYSSSPLFPANLKPALSVDSDELFVAFCASTAGEISDRNGHETDNDGSLKTTS
jgi:hypothetical protein